MFMNSVHQGANAFAFSNRIITAESHRLSRASGTSRIEHCTLTQVHLDCTNAVNAGSLITVDNSRLSDCTLQTTGALAIAHGHMQRCRLSVEGLLRITASHLRCCHLRLQPGSGLIVEDNDCDVLNIDGTGGFSHTFTLQGLFTRSRFKGLLIAGGQLQAIFYRTLWRDTLVRHSVLNHSLFNRCVLDDLRFHDCSFSGSTFSHCETGQKPLVFERCDLRGCRFIQIHPRQCRFIDCRGISAASFTL
ncbi:hypothetical protein GKQ23_06855 [Erwinia sp. E602]|uniref:pentapeptide repeat-containing protein n=1 Tax=Erwinia sp. E602 TaxID=2675378 RepID=UPI001BA7DBF9|nr:pentapeptide repeat-containing protein [Erwinia sp. E602]QUG74732.1 hypothetical protein GKQ23_06855 [Erwinia sp. E602]